VSDESTKSKLRNAARYLRESLADERARYDEARDALEFASDANVAAAKTFNGCATRVAAIESALVEVENALTFSGEGDAE
jgi:hypothetical protein